MRLPMHNYIELGSKIYNVKKFNQLRRIVVFVIRSLVYNHHMENLLSFFRQDRLLQEIADKKPCIFEQATRQVFYYHSTIRERAALIKRHYQLVKDKFTAPAIRKIYFDGGFSLCEQECKGKMLSLSLNFADSQIKEGCMALTLHFDNKWIYQITFWLDADKQGKAALWIGALQGATGKSKTIHDLTKAFFGYRTKNLILYAMRIVARELGVKRMYAVSNQGFYANNHCRLDRKLKTSLDDFWLETGGKECSDPRFFKLPVTEPRKTIEEVVSHKRNLYRKRFAALDELDASMTGMLQTGMKQIV